jgi:hypothetical protein
VGCCSGDGTPWAVAGRGEARRGGKRQKKMRMGQVGVVVVVVVEVVVDVFERV